MTLSEIRNRSGLKCYIIAEQLGVTRQQLYNLETGKFKLDKLKIEKLCKIFNKTQKEIINAWEESLNDK